MRGSTAGEVRREVRQRARARMGRVTITITITVVVVIVVVIAIYQSTMDQGCFLK